MEEVWKDIKGFEEHYRISNTGKIYTYNRDKIMKSSFDKNGYLRCTLMLNGKHFYYRINRLVALTKLNNTQVLKLRIDYKNGLKRKLIAIKYNISIRNVYRVANGEHYFNV